MVKMVENLHKTTLNIRDELQRQDVILDDLGEKTDKVKDSLDKATEKVEKILKISNDGSSKFCSYMICFVLLLGILTVLYNVIVGGQQ